MLIVKMTTQAREAKEKHMLPSVSDLHDSTCAAFQA